MMATTPFLEGTSDIPPPIPEHANLQSMRWFKLDIMNLLNSDFIHKATHEELGAAFLLWTKSVHQLPAGSLPNDDVVLARMAGFDPRSKRWKRSRDMILYGWTLCSDARLYHPTVSETVLGMLDTGTQGKPRDGQAVKDSLLESNRRRQRRFKERQRGLLRTGKSEEDTGLSEQAKSESVTQVTPEVTLPITPEVTLPVTEVTLPGNAIDIDRDREGDKEKQTSVTGNAQGNVTVSVTSVTEPLPDEPAVEPSAPGGAGLFVTNSTGCVAGMEGGNPQITAGGASPSARFDEFWEIYPSKVGKKPAMQKWRSMKLDRVADEIIADVRARLQKDHKWLSGYTPNPATYLHQERWKDQWQQAALPASGPRDIVVPGKPSGAPAFPGLSRPGQRTAMAVQQWLEKEVVQ